MSEKTLAELAYDAKRRREIIETELAKEKLKLDQQKREVALAQLEKDRKLQLAKLEVENPFGSNFGMLLFLFGGFIGLVVAIGIITFVITTIIKFVLY